MTPELHRPVPSDWIGPAGLDVAVEATASECTALAARMKLPVVLALSCRFHLRRERANTVLAHGHLRAEVVQTCVLSLEDFASIVEERFVVRCVPAGQESDDIDPEAPDDLPFTAGMIDLGEAAAQQLALALDPYPRAPGAALPVIEQDADLHPFSAFAGLRRRH